MTDVIGWLGDYRYCLSTVLRAPAFQQYFDKSVCFCISAVNFTGLMSSFDYWLNLLLIGFTFSIDSESLERNGYRNVPTYTKYRFNFVSRTSEEYLVFNYRNMAITD
jgi:hypothetical protein